MFPKWITFILTYYSLWGFCFILPAKYNKKSFMFVIIASHCALVTSSIYCVFKTFSPLLKHTGPLDVLNLLLYYIVSILSYLMIICDSYVNRVNQFEYWEKFSRIKEDFCAQINLRKWSYLIALVVLNVGNCSYPGSDELMNLHSFCIIDNRMLFYVLHLKVISSQLWTIKTELNLIQHFDGYRYKWIRGYYEIVHEMCNLVNSVFGFSNLAILMMIFHTALTFLNSLYLLIQKNFHGTRSGWLIRKLKYIYIYTTRESIQNIF